MKRRGNNKVNTILFLYIFFSYAFLLGALYISDENLYFEAWLFVAFAPVTLPYFLLLNGSGIDPQKLERVASILKKVLPFLPKIWEYVRRKDKERRNKK